MYVRWYSFGWDWGPTLPTSGIWRKAQVVAYNTARLGYVAGCLRKYPKIKRVKLSAEVHTRKETILRVKLALIGFGQKVEQNVEVKTKAGRNFADCSIEVEDPKLWWPRGYGDPNLYEAIAEVYDGEKLLDKTSVYVGIRSIRLLQEPDEEGKTFIFEINGLNVFCKGANWIPADSFLPKVTYERYYELLDLAAEANFNMLRVWGGVSLRSR